MARYRGIVDITHPVSVVGQVKVLHITGNQPGMGNKMGVAFGANDIVK